MEHLDHCTAFLTDESDVVVVGSCFINLLHYIPNLPTAGGDIQGCKFKQYFSGKGANQCIALRKLGASVALIAKLGDDKFGRTYLNELDENGVNTKYIWLLKNMSTGIISSFILSGNETFQTVTIPGANAFLSPADIESARNMLLQAKVIIFQGETPWGTTLYCLNKLLVSLDSRAKIIINVSPAIKILDPRVLIIADIIVLNETEAGVLTNTTIRNEEDIETCAEKLLDMKCNTIIITLGGSGVVYATKDNKRLKTVEVDRVENPVDIKGVGDCFVGALAYYLCYFSSLPLGEIISRACKIARLSILKCGVQNSFPLKENINSELFSNICDNLSSL